MCAICYARARKISCPYVHDFLRDGARDFMTICARFLTQWGVGFHVHMGMSCRGVRGKHASCPAEAEMREQRGRFAGVQRVDSQGRPGGGNGATE